MPTFRLASLLLSSLLMGSAALAAGKPPAEGQGAAGWATAAEASGYRKTPRYDETMAYLRRLSRAAPRQLKLERFGKTGEGRDLFVAIASKDGEVDPAKLHAAGRPIVLIQNAIHAGEMDGKDSCLALLRDLLVTRELSALLDKAVLVIIPIYNADGHERFGPYNRVNQNGPEEMGWRTQSQNLNLNRDYMKADAPETRAFLKLWNRWSPDFFVDDHVTDGADYAYDVTYYLETGPEAWPAAADWQRSVVAPALEESVTRAGHSISPFIALKDDADPSKGLTSWPSTPRFSTGYAALRNRPALLVEMHMLKDYKTRVTGNYEVLRALLELLNRDGEKLVRMNRSADEAMIAAGRAAGSELFPIRVEVGEETKEVPYRGARYRRSLSEISGSVRIEYLPETQEVEVPRPTALKVTRSVRPPAAYLVPVQWTAVVEVLEAHGLKLRRLASAWTGEVETYRCEGMKWLDHPYEGRQVLFAPPESRTGQAQGGCVPVKETLSFPPGSVLVPLDQPAAKVAIHFLEPEAPDSAVSWGFFNAAFEQKEYAEAYVVEKLAREMLEKDPALRAAFEAKLAEDREFAASPEARLAFFYRRSPWWDARFGLYPVARLESVDGLPLASAK